MNRLSWDTTAPRRLTGKRVAVIQSGGNIDRALFAQVLAEEDDETAATPR